MLKKKVWAVVGVTTKKDRFGYKIFKKLQEHGYETYGVNPKYEEVDGEKVYPTLKSIPKKIEVVDVVVPPKVTLGLLDEIKDLGIEYIWFQPGTYDEEVVEKAESLGFKNLFNDCVYATLIARER
ncbi:MAG: CoA-binding protein [Tissierellia bacterium]|nr:CoA-binding protein [Tissierellia bacterium]